MPRFAINFGQRPQRPHRDVNHASVLASRSEVFGFSRSSDRFTFRRQAFRPTGQIRAFRSDWARRYRATAFRLTVASSTAAEAGRVSLVLASMIRAMVSQPAKNSRRSRFVSLDSMNPPTKSFISSSVSVGVMSSSAAARSGSFRMAASLVSSLDPAEKHTCGCCAVAKLGECRRHLVATHNAFFELARCKAVSAVLTRGTPKQHLGGV